MIFRVLLIFHSIFYFLIRTNSWAVCPNGYFVRGFYRSSGDWLHNIEEAKCCKPETFPDRYEHCYNENILSSFDNKGLSKCKKAGYYVAGIYKGGCDKLYCIEMLKCCKMNVGEKGYHVGYLSCKNCSMANGLLKTASTGQYSTIFFRRDIKKK